MPLSELGIYRFSLAFTVIVWADPISFVSASDYSTLFKYSYTFVIFFFILIYLTKWHTVNSRSAGPILAFAFFVITTCVFFVNLIEYGYRLSYASAFTSSLIFAASVFIPPGTIEVDHTRILKQITLVFLFCTLCYLNENIVKEIDFFKPFLYYRDVEHIKAIVCVIGLCISILTRQRILILVYVTIMTAALLLRPTSTMVLGVFVCVPIAFALRSRAFFLAGIAINGVLFVAAITPFAFYYFFDQVAAVIELAEFGVKTDALGGLSNTQFRLAVIKEALRQFENGSFLFGNGLNGDVTVYIARELPYWIKENIHGLAQIHSDFIIVLTQSGLIGYLLFIFFIYSILRLRMRQLARIGVTSQSLSTILSTSVIGVVALIIYSSANPVFQEYHVAHVVWMLLLISEVAIFSTRLTGNIYRVDSGK